MEARDEFDKELNEMIDKLMLMGLIEVTGIDAASEEFLYKINPDIYELFPDLQMHIHDAFLEQVDNLWVKGFLLMDFSEANPMVSLTDLAFNEDSVRALNLDERNALMLIMHAMRKE